MTPEAGGGANQSESAKSAGAASAAAQARVVTSSSRRVAMRAAVVSVLLLAAGIGTNRLYNLLRTPPEGFDRMITDVRRIDAEIGPALASAGYGRQFEAPQGLAPMLESRQIAPDAAGRAVVVSRKSLVSQTKEGLAAGGPVPQGVVSGGEGEIELHNDTEADATLVLAAYREPGRVLKSSPLPSGGGAIVRGLRPETYTLFVTFADYPRSPIRLGPFLIMQTATPQGTVADRYEIHLRPRPTP